jgi:hypothetical protein
VVAAGREARQKPRCMNCSSDRVRRRRTWTARELGRWRVARRRTPVPGCRKPERSLGRRLDLSEFSMRWISIPVPRILMAGRHTQYSLVERLCGTMMVVNLSPTEMTAIHRPPWQPTIIARQNRIAGPCITNESESGPIDRLGGRNNPTTMAGGRCAMSRAKA